MNIYLDNGYLDIPKILKPKIFSTVIFVGPRGCGKSFGILDYCTKQATNTGKRFFYMRTRQNEIDSLTDPELNPFEDLNVELGTTFTLVKRPKTNLMGIFPDGSKETIKNDDNLLGLCCALSTIHTKRGMSAKKYNTIFYDEFIPEPHVPKLPEQGKAVKATYETFNRNRELNGDEPMKLILSANADDINNDVLAIYRVLDDILKMKSQDKEVIDYPDRRIRVVYPFKSKIAKLKKNTALYQSAGKNDDYTKMALDNDFVSYYGGNIKSMNLKNYKPYIRLGDMGIYISKDGSKTFYFSNNTNDKFKYSYGMTDFELSQFIYNHKLFTDLYLKGLLIFENSYLEIKFLHIFKR